MNIEEIAKIEELIAQGKTYDEIMTILSRNFIDDIILEELNDCDENLTKRTSEEWQILKPNVIVFDPDGWDRENYQFSWHEELITEEEYEQRLSRSTCIVNENSNHWSGYISKEEED